MSGNAPHWDHDIHGPMFQVWPDDSVTVDEDCDCPLDCDDCEDEGIDREVSI